MPYVLHIEIQSDNDEAMLSRMIFYKSLIFDKYGLDSKQFVIYIGAGTITMKSQISLTDCVYSYQIIDIKRYDYELFLQANTPEEVVLAILGDFKGEEAKSVINKILLRLRALVPASLSLAKYTTQLEVVSNLRNLHLETLNQINNMPVPFDFTITTAYKKGATEGEAKGKKEDAFGMLAEGLKPDAIVRITKLPLETILEWQKEWEAQK